MNIYLGKTYVGEADWVGQTYDGVGNLKALISRDASFSSFPIPDTTTAIGSYAFRYWDSLTSLEIPASVKSLNSYALYYCRGLLKVTISEGCINIERYAFGQCKALQQVNIPSTVTTIGTNAFLSTSSDLVVTINKAPDSISGAPWGNATATIVWNN